MLNIIDPWYKEGLKFKCTECGKCCSGFPGYVWLNERDIEMLASHLNLSIKDFKIRYTRSKHGKLSLTEMKNFDCVFFKEGKCSVYKARPSQCRTFPFWLSNIKTKRDWENAREGCEGIDHPEGDLIPLHQIQKELKTYLEDSGERL